MLHLERLAAHLLTHVCKARIGFICGKYEASFWYYELLEMTRKTMLMAVACELLPLSLWPELLPVSYCPLATAPLSHCPSAL